MFMTNRAELLKKVFSGLAGFNDEIIFRINQDCLFFSMMTRDNTSMIIVKLPASIFSKYEFLAQQDVKVNAVIMKKIIGNANKDDNVYISFDETYSQIKVTLSSAKFKKSYEVPLISLKEDDSFKTDVPELKHDIEVKCVNREVSQMIDALLFSAMKGYGDSITISGDDKYLSFKEETQYGKTMLTLKDFDKEGIKKKVSVNVSYGLIKPLVTFQESLIESSSYCLRKDYPVRVYGKNDEIDVSFILAPRVENE
jgi:DNA polymerase III sliding clamp (beta) subunit (PCNA family)